jgi:tryptophan synthase alpha subunit
VDKFLYNLNNVPAAIGKAATSSGAGQEHVFGMDKEKVVAMLRDFADGVENGTVLVQEIHRINHNTLDDFEMETLQVKFAPARPKQGE